MSMEDLVDLPVELELGAMKLKLRRLNDQDIVALDKWVRAKVISIAQESLNDDMSDDERQEVLNSAYTKAMQTTWLTGDGQALISSSEGIARIIYQACLTPNVDPSHLHMCMYNKDYVLAAKEALDQISPKIPGSVPMGKHEPQPGRARPKKRKDKKNQSTGG